MKQRLLVTGGAGFIGSNFIRYMLNKYKSLRIINLDKLTYAGCLENLKDVRDNPRNKFIKGDICNANIVGRIVKDCDVIINFAAETHVDRSIVEPSEFIRTNVYGTYTLLEAARKNRIRLFCHIGTDEVFGSREKGFFKETDSLKPSSPYSASKAAADHLVHSYYVTYKLPVLIVRSTNNFGPFQFPEKIIPLFITNALEGKRLPVYARGQNVRDWIYVLDNCRAIDWIIHKGKKGEIYNVAGKNQMRNIDLSRLILKMMKKPDNLIKFVKDRPGHDFRYALDCAKLNKLGWRARYTFGQALKDTIDWYKNNQDWWQSIKHQD